MSALFLGKNIDTKKPFYLPKKSFETHWHLIGGTGKGKTTALHRILHELLLDPLDESCVIIVDRMGNLSFDLLLWMASDFCTEDVRDRLVYIEPAREDVVIGFNPLIYQTEGGAYYRVSRTAEIILRGWDSQDLGQMPRLSRWLFNSFYACALLGLTVADTAHLVLPGSPIHKQFLGCLPPILRAEWAEIVNAKGPEASRILDSTRNRLKPFYVAPALRRMFGSTANRMDLEQFMREKKILLLNLAPGGQIPAQIADAIGGMVINEVLNVARSLPIGMTLPTYLVLDEFQRFIGPDIQDAIPEVRQLGIRLMLGHQSFSQLVQGNVDLTSMIFQAQSRMIFGLQGLDADIIAEELAALHFDPYKIKQEMYSRKQRIAGHEKQILNSWGFSESDAQSWLKHHGESLSKFVSQTANEHGKKTADGTGTTRAATDGSGEGNSKTRGSSEQSREQLVPIHEDFEELVSRTFFTFDEDKREWGRDVRRATTGEAFVRVVDQPKSHHVQVKQSAAGHLSFTKEQLREYLPEVFDDVERLKEKNFASDLFTSPQAIDREIQMRLERILGMPIDMEMFNTTPEIEHQTLDEKEEGGLL